MDRRVTLSIGSEISFPGMDCVIEEVVGKGSNAVVYRGRYRDCSNRDLFHRVLIKELFPYHPKNTVYRDEKGNIVTEMEAKAFFDLQKTSFDYGNSVHLRMLEMYPDRVGGNINTFSKNGTLYSIMNFDGGKALDKEYLAGDRNLTEAVLLLKQILGALEIFHDSGYLHLDISPDNILVIGKGENRRISLIDYNSVHKLEEIRAGASLYCSAKEGYTSPEIINMNMSAVSESSDIYSVTAVFYWLLTGKILTPFQRLCSKAPGVKDSPLLNGVPDTVLWQINAILRKGLSTLPEKRYRSCEQMSQAVSELLNRIESVGITHSALWDSGVRMVNGMIKTNPSLRYLTKPGELYPIRVICSDGESLVIEKAVERCLEKGSVMIMGNGGMGKTTALLHTAVIRSKSYSPIQPATVYVSLYDYNSGGYNFIKNRILQSLRFEKGVSDLEDARRRLVAEFSKTLKTRDGEKPSYLLLIDGFNEASGDTQGLMREIAELSCMPGVRIILSSRSSVDTAGFEVYTMARLEQQDIRSRLQEKGLLYPESPEIREIISIPLMLSVFCDAALDSEKQLSCKTVNELLDEYISGLCRKETVNLEEASPLRWSVEAAVKLVLPYICAELTRKNQLLGERELLKTVAKCYRLVRSRGIATLFPDWIGHSKDIRNGCSTAEEWYSLVVLNILWRRMGLLVKEQGGYRIMHQRLQEYLLEDYRKISRKVKIRKGVFASAGLVLLGAAVLLWSLFIRPDPYDEKLTENYFTGVVDCVARSGSEIELLSFLAECEGNSSEYISALNSLETLLRLHGEVIEQGYGGSYAMALELYGKLKETGEVVPWSMQKIDENSTEMLFSLNKEIYEGYGTYAEIITFLHENEELDKKYGEQYRKALKEKLEADAALCDALYSVAIEPHLELLRDKDSKLYSYYRDTLSGFADLSDRDSDNPDAAEIGRLRKESAEKKTDLEALEIFTFYRRER